MPTSISFADILFILLVGGIIYFFVYWFGPVRKARMDRVDSSKRPDSES